MFWIVYGPLSITVLILVFSYQLQIGVLDVVVIKAAMKTNGGVVAVKTMFQVTRVAMDKNLSKENMSLQATASVSEYVRCL